MTVSRSPALPLSSFSSSCRLPAADRFSCKVHFEPGYLTCALARRNGRSARDANFPGNRVCPRGSIRKPSVQWIHPYTLSKCSVSRGNRLDRRDPIHHPYLRARKKMKNARNSSARLGSARLGSATFVMLARRETSTRGRGRRGGGEEISWIPAAFSQRAAGVDSSPPPRRRSPPARRGLDLSH